MSLIIAFAALAVATLLYVFWITPEPVKTRTPLERELDFLAERKEMVYEGLRDLQMEYRMGKLSDGDYQNLKLSYQRQLAEILEDADRLSAGEAVTTPPAPEPEAASGRCSACGADNPGSNRFCGSCGASLSQSSGGAA